MKIKTRFMEYEKVMALPRPRHLKPRKPSFLLSSVIRLISIPDFIATRFKSTGSIPKDLGPCLILMNHSSFIDLKIAYKLLYPRRFGIVCTSDGFIGKNLLMRFLGCIPTKKFVTDITLVNDIKHMLKDKKISVLMYPEASYSFDGKATPLPRRMGILLKKLNVPVVYIKTCGAFTRDPLYNGLQLRKVPVSANIECLLTEEQIKTMSVDEIDDVLDRAFNFDHFAWQRDNNITVKEKFRADFLERILYRCPACKTEGHMVGRGIRLSCKSCGKAYIMDELGRLIAESGETEFSHIPDWYHWQRQEVKREIENGSYRLDVPVKIGMMVDFKAIYNVGDGRLIHTSEGFSLTGCDGKLNYSQPPKASYGLYADYYWYEIGDVICIGDNDALYYCFPPEGVPVAKARLAAEELYKLHRRNRRNKTALAEV